MKSIQFHTGMREYAINGNESNVIRIYITDMNLPIRMKTAGKKLDELAARFGDQSLTPELAAELDAQIRTIMNEAFGTDVCTPAFGSANCMSPVDADGTALWQVFFSALMEQIKSDIAAISPKVQQYVNSAPSPVGGAVSPHVAELSAEEKQQLIAKLLK